MYKLFNKFSLIFLFLLTMSVVTAQEEVSIDIENYNFNLSNCEFYTPPTIDDDSKFKVVVKSAAGCCSGSGVATVDLDNMTCHSYFIFNFSLQSTSGSGYADRGSNTVLTPGTGTDYWIKPYIIDEECNIICSRPQQPLVLDTDIIMPLHEFDCNLQLEVRCYRILITYGTYLSAPASTGINSISNFSEEISSDHKQSSGETTIDKNDGSHGVNTNVLLGKVLSADRFCMVNSCNFTDSEFRLSSDEIKDLELRATPNPFSDELNIVISPQEDVSVKQVFIFDITGKIVHEARLKKGFPNEEIKLNIDLSNLNNGTYFLNTIDNNGRSNVIKLVKI